GATGVYGTQGAAVASNVPGARSGGVGWVDGNSNLWLFGGTDLVDKWNDLWQYDVTTGLWTWVAGSDLADQVGSFGNPGVAASTNSPSAKAYAVGFIDTAGHFWLFGGQSIVTQGTGGSGPDFNDLWEYQP
ncbi:MAG: kelch repeat-containing protein, partial [Terracidiphilus sp.]